MTEDDKIAIFKYGFIAAQLHTALYQAVQGIVKIGIKYYRCKMKQ